jgi:hypothetical protein
MLVEKQKLNSCHCFEHKLLVSSFRTPLPLAATSKQKKTKKSIVSPLFQKISQFDKKIHTVCFLPRCLWNQILNEKQKLNSCHCFEHKLLVSSFRTPLPLAATSKKKNKKSIVLPLFQKISQFDQKIHTVCFLPRCLWNHILNEKQKLNSCHKRCCQKLNVVAHIFHKINMRNSKDKQIT